MKKQKTSRRFVIGICLVVAPVISMGSSDTTQALIEILRSEAPIFQKARACQQLGESGTQEAVPALASLLDDSRLSAYARTGLERIPGPQASAALRDAMGRLQGTRQIGVIHSLGALRDEKAVRALGTLTRGSDPEVARAALLALGRIANEAALSRVVEALATGPADSRPDAAAACLLGAGHLLKQGKAERALTLYSTVLQTPLPVSFHVGATRGAILSRHTGDTSFLVEQLRSEKPAMRHVAILTLRQNPSEAFATVLNAEIDRAERGFQIQCIEALTDCHNSQSFSVLWAKVASGDAAVRLAALKVLEAIGGPDSAPVLIKVLQESHDEAAISVAVSILGRLEGAQVDAQILKALSSAKASQVRMALMGLLGKRAVTGAADALLHQADDPDTKVSIAAYQALKSVARSDALPSLMTSVKRCRDDSVRDAAVNAVYSVCKHSDDSVSSGAMLLGELKTTTVTAEKMAWIRVLALLGYADALPTITAMLQDSNQAFVQNTISQLGRWPDPMPINDLFRVVERDARAGVRTRALAAVLQLATTAADHELVPQGTLAAWFKRASHATRSVQEKRLLISGLGRVVHVEGLQLLASYLDDPDVKMEAIHAIVNAAGPLAKGPAYAAVDRVLDRMPDLTDPRLLRQIADLKRDIRTTAARLKE